VSDISELHEDLSVDVNIARREDGNIAKGKPNIAEGEPNIAEGEPNIAEGEPNIAEGEPNIAREEDNNDESNILYD
jgi:hypothetical protein